MVDQARQNEAVGGSLLTEAGARDYLYRLFQQRGINPANNIWARNIMNRANEAAYLMNVMGVQDAGAQDFLGAWMNGRWGGGGSSNYQGTDLTRQGITGYVNNAMQNQDPTDWRYKFFNTGDPDQDFQNLQAAQGLQYGGYARGVQQAQQNVLGDWFQGARSGMQANPNASTNVLDWWFKRQPASGYMPEPPGGGGGGGAYNPTPAPTPQQPGGGGAYNPAPRQTPPQRAPGPGEVTYPENPALQPPGTVQPYSDWNALLNKYRADQRNWGTEGYRPNVGAFTLGDFTYDPNQDTVRDWLNMGGSDSGGKTQRGNFMGQFMYYLNLLMNQRNGSGNAALGITRATTDDQLARIAAQRMGKNAVGSSGFTIRS